MTPKNRIIPIFVPHLGCPNDCVFCNQRRISGRMTPATPETVKAELSKALSLLPPEQTAEIAFYGGSFTAIPEKEQGALLSAAQPYLASGRIHGIRVSTRPDCIDGETIDRLRKYGVKTVELGAQSMDETVLRLSGRGHTGEDVRKAAKMLKDAGFHLILQMMTGLPGDTAEKSLKTAEELIALQPDGVRVYPTVIVKDTRLYDMWKAGVYKEHTVQDAVSVCAKLSRLFQNAGISVIRMGLNPTEDLSHGDAVGGAYHPAFGELVRSQIYLEEMCALLEGRELKGGVTFGVAKGQISAAVGQKRCNIQYISQKYGVKPVKITEIDIKVGKVILID